MVRRLQSRRQGFLPTDQGQQIGKDRGIRDENDGLASAGKNRHCLTYRGSHILIRFVAPREMPIRLSSLIDVARQAARAGRWNEAESRARAILLRDPQAVDALEIIAMSRRQSGDAAQAEAALRKAISITPDRRWPFGDLARLLIDMGRLAEAELVERQALAVDPANADAHMLLGRMLADRGMVFEGTGHLKRAIALVGRHPELLAALGRALSQQGALDEARGLLEEAVRAGPQDLTALTALAEVEERAGRFARASHWLDRAEVVASGQGSDVILQRSVLLSRMGEDAAALALLEAQAVLSGVALLQRGRLRDRLGRHGEAWADWGQGKTSIAAQTGRRYAADVVGREAAQFVEFAGRLPPLHKHVPQDDRVQPVFILGFPRSGTTLVEQIIAAHDAVRAGGELPFGMELRELAEPLAGTSDDERAERLRNHYLARAGEYGLTGGGMRFFTDKMPLNEFHLPLIRLAFPAAKVIRVVRHPLDVLVSVLSHDMTHGQNCGYRIEDAAQHFALIQRQVEAYQAAGLSVDHTLRYEAMVGDQAGETEALMAALGLDMQSRQLAFHCEERHAPTPSYAQVREPLNDRSIGRWKAFARELEPVLPVVREAMEALGYAA